MGERIKVKGIHIKCGWPNLSRSVGGDIMSWCDYCNEQLSDPKKEILTERQLIIEPWLYLWFWFKRNFLRKGGKK